MFNKLALRIGAQKKQQFHFPWEIVLTTDINFGPIVKVRPGTVNGAMPSNMFDFFSYNPTELNPYYVVAGVNTDGLSVNNVTMSLDTSSPDPVMSQKGFPPSYFEILIGLVVNGRAFQLVNRLITASPNITILTQRNNPQLGAPFYDLNYTWQLTTY